MSSQSQCLIALSLFAFACAGCGGSTLPAPRTPPPPKPVVQAVVKAPVQQTQAPEQEPSDKPTNVATRKAGDADHIDKVRQPAEEKTPAPAGLNRLTSQQRYDRSVNNLKRIGEAIGKYVNDNGHYPHRDMHGASLRYRMQSWRVALLPYLSETELYQQCQPKEYWNAPENAHMLKRIPDVYRSNAVDDSKCNYLFVVGPGTCFAQNKSARPEQFDDGIENTILVVEVADSFGVAWTNPTDLEILTAVEKRPFAAWNGDGFLALLANGEVVQVSPQALEEELRAMLTIAGGEKLAVKEYLRSRSEAKIERLARASGGPILRSSSDTAATADRTQANARGFSADNKARQGATPVPSAEQQGAAMELVKQLYLDRYQQAENNRDKQQLAKEMFAKSAQTGSDVAGQYVMLTTAQRIALEHDDLETAKDCLDKLVDNFDLDAFDMQVALLRKSASLTTESSFDTRLMDEARQLMEEAAQRDDYKAASDMAQVALAAGRRLSDKDEVAAIIRRQREIEKMAAAYRRVQRALSQQDVSQADPLMNEMVGRYFCLMKGDWERGLPYLASGDDTELQGLAQHELTNPDDPARQLALADQWWDLIEQASSLEGTHIRRRALKWYQAAEADLPQGLAKLKAELRIKELKDVGQ